MFAVIQKIKISETKHTFKYLPHEHTSFGLLAFILFIIGAILVVASANVSALDPPPQSSSIGLSGSVPAKPPTTAATIGSPTPNQHFTTVPITVTGSCPQGTLIEIYKNDIFAGSTNCSNSGTYSLQIDLLFGQNVLVAKDYDTLDQEGPDSNTVTVFYDASLPGGLSTNFVNLIGQQLLLNTNAAYRGSFPGQQLNVPITVIGGTPPFAINVEWGDLKNQVVADASSSVTATHAYAKPGTYEISLQGSDSKHLAAFLNVEAIINGQPATVASSLVSSKKASSILTKLWPLFAVTVTIVVSFWMGERREKKLLKPAPPIQMLPPNSTSPQPQH